MKVSIKDMANKEVGSASLPSQFSEEYRPDLIIRAVLSLQSKARQRYGADPEAGMKVSAKISRRRRDYRGSYGFGISRVPRKIMSRRGTRMNWVGAEAPGTVSGRRAHPPKAEKIWDQKINKTENRKAIRSALAATMNKELVAKRGHKVPKDYPFILSNDFENVAKTRDIVVAFGKLDLGAELERAEEKKVRAGKGTMRNRRYKRKTGPLLVVSSADVAVTKGARNLSGIDVVSVQSLNAELLAPGTHAGRITLFTEAAIKRLSEEKLFTQNYRNAEASEKAAQVRKVKDAKAIAKKVPAKKTSKAVAKKASKKTAKVAQ